MASRRRRPFTVRVEYPPSCHRTRVVQHLVAISPQVAFLDVVPRPAVGLARLEPVVQRLPVTPPCRPTTCPPSVEGDVEKPALRPLDDNHLVAQHDRYARH